MIVNKIREIVNHSSTLNKLLKDVTTNKRMIIKGLSGSIRSIVLTSMFENVGSKFLYIANDEEQVEILKDDLEVILGKDKVAFLADQKDRPYESVFRDTLRKGLYQEALEKLINNQVVIVITTANVVSKKLLSHNIYKKQELVIKKGETNDFEIFKSILFDLGFTREPVIESCGEMSIRGGIIDIFPYSREYPLRVEFFGDVIESIREFDITSQRSIRNISQAIIYPQFPENQDSDGNLKFVSLLDYFDNDPLIFLEESKLIAQIVDDNFDDAVHQYNLKINREELPSPENLYLNWDEIEKELAEYKIIYFDSLTRHQFPVYDFSVIAQQSLRGNFNFLKGKIDALIQNKNFNKTSPDIFFLCESNDQIDRLEDIMSDNGIDVEKINYAVCPLNQGFVFPEVNLAVFTDNQFYGRVRRRFQYTRILKGLSFRQLKSLAAGDYVVHVDQGIGRYLGLKRISVNGHERECLTIEYRDGDLLYVPLEKMKRVQKYAAKEGVAPHISKLGGGEWEKLKKRTKKKVKDIARELIRLYANRRTQQAFSFSKDTLWQKELEASFAYDETPDQLQAAKDIKQDMENSKPMDRLVCGDVGYGKTEVALRAAFKAVNDNKQIAILVPTTVLALQHFNTFQERLKDYPIKVEMLSRFRSMAEQKKMLEWLKNGKVDIIIGTHRLLSKDIEFNDLGLIVVDEEQRFGVTHKEKLKQLKINADVLTMTATPIPRTLNMALIGVRDMSLINTPPQGRLPIHTEVIPFDKKLIRIAILKEMERGGQVFFVHNRVRSIYTVADQLKQLVPEVTFAVAHGQMESKHLEKIMWEFASKKYDCLISTMIIESGLDIPNVNTLIINRADRFGLSQLYQLRGRVGRSHQRAYAYLISPPISHLTKEAIKRLRTIEEFTELGSGFQIAMRDLQIRGAGNILGGEQSGFIVSLGFDLYCKILDEAINELKLEQQGKKPLETKTFEETKVDLKVDAYLPQDYIEQSDERVHFYRRLGDIAQQNELLEIEQEMRDRFGVLPGEAKNLIYLIELKILGTQLKLKNVKIDNQEMLIQFHEDVVSEDRELLQKRLVSIVNKAKTPFTFIQDDNQNLGIKMIFEDNISDKFEFSINFLQDLL